MEGRGVAREGRRVGRERRGVAREGRGVAREGMGVAMEERAGRNGGGRMQERQRTKCFYFYAIWKTIFVLYHDGFRTMNTCPL